MSSANPAIRFGAPLVAVVVGGVIATTGCGTRTDQSPGMPAERQVTAEDVEAGALQTEQQGTGVVVVSDQGSRLHPVALLPTDETLLAIPLSSPALVRVTAGSGESARILAEAESSRRQVLSVDRRSGIRLGSEQLVRGALPANVELAVYLLPPGGVRQETVRQTIRAATPDELEADRARRREAAAREAEAATTQPAPSPQ